MRHATYRFGLVLMVAYGVSAKADTIFDDFGLGHTDDATAAGGRSPLTICGRAPHPRPLFSELPLF
jgi:hypothetical protein